MKTVLTNKLSAIILLVIGMLSQTITNAQWTSKASNFPQLQRGFTEMIAVNSQVAWGLAYERDHEFINPLTDFTRTIDGGNTWIGGNIASMPDQFLVGMEPVSGTSAFFLSAVSDFIGKVLKTTDGGITWTQLNVAPFPVFYINIHFFNANDGVVMGDACPSHGQGRNCMIIFTTQDGGNTWTQVPKANLPNHGSEHFYSWSMCAVGNTIWTVSTVANIWKSTDKGLHWSKYQTSDHQAIVSNIKMRDAMHGLWGIDDELYRTIDGGVTWTEVDPIGTFFTFDLAYVPGTISTYVSTGGDTSKVDNNGGTSALHGIGSSYSTDDGDTWITIDTAIDHLAIAMVNSTTGFSGGFNTNASNGVFKYSGPAFSPRSMTNQLTDAKTKSSSFTANETNLPVAYPNPLSNSTTISFSLSRSEKVSLKVFDIKGRLISTLSNKIFEAGDHKLSWNAYGITEGIYFLQFQSTATLKVLKLIVLK